MKIRRQFNEQYKGSQGEPKSEKPSKTQPDMTISIKQLLLNHVRGIPSNVGIREDGYYETEIPVITDLNDYAEHKARLMDQAAELKRAMDEEAMDSIGDTVPEKGGRTKKSKTSNPEPEDGDTEDETS